MPTITTIGNQHYHIDLSTNRITFLDGRFYYTENGTPVPSVTTVLNAYPKGAAFYEWLKKNGEDSDAIRDEAGRRGSKVHLMTEQYDKGEEVSLFGESGELSISMLEWAMFERYVEFRNRFSPEIIDIETHIISEELCIAGTRDRVILLNGKRILLDIKTGNYIGKEAWLQLSAYQAIDRANGHPPYDGIAILHLAAKTKTEGRKDAIQGKGWQLLVEYDQKVIDQYYTVFMHTHKLWLSENKDLMPRQASYQLRHKVVVVEPA
jgi:hypothetical protein